MLTLSIFEMMMLVLLIIGTAILFVLMSFHHVQIEEERQKRQYSSKITYDEYVEYS